jgi:cytidylate kinase
MKRGYKLVAERYIFDTITTIAYFIDDIDLLNSTVSNLLIRFIPRNTVFLFLDSDYETIFQRRAPLFGDKRYDENKKIYGAVPKSAVEPRDFIDFQRRAYHALAASSEALIVYTPEFSIEETHSIILDYLHLR